MKTKEKKQFNVLIPILLLLVVVVAVIYGTSRNWSGTIESKKKSLGEQVVNQVSTFYDKIENIFSILSGFGTTFTEEEIGNLDYIEQKINQGANKTDFVTVSFVYPDGHLYRNDGRDIDVADRQYFKKCMEGESVVAFLKNPYMDDEPVVGMCVPVWGEEEVAGILLGAYDMDAFRELLEACMADISNLSYICDSQGDFIIGTEHADSVMDGYGEGDEKLGFLDILEESEFTESSKAEVTSNMSNGLGGQAAYTFRGEKRYTTYEPLGINDWYIVTVLPEEQIYSEAMQSASVSYITLVIVMTAIVLAILYFAYREHQRVIDEKERAEEIKYRLDHDDLTGVLCEKAFVAKIEERLKTIGSKEYCLVYMDVYKFKLINEMFSYEKGDELLRVIAKDLSLLAEEYDGHCCRISGDKFVLFVPNKEEALNHFYTQKQHEERILPIEIYLHYGIYVIHDVTIPVSRMIDCAQLAQKAIKGQYDNCISYYNDEIKQKIIKEQEIINSMTKALASGEFIIYLQPQYNYKEGKISGAEALVRWKHPEKGLIPPCDFIPIFETNGFIIKLDENVWEQVCKLQRKWLDEGLTPLPISVNVSRADLLKGAVAEKLMGLIEKYDLTPDLLRVEVTETAYMDNPQQLITEIDKLRNNGLLVEMDDFGSGYSSLNMLKDVPIQVLKTDLKFLDGSGIEARKERILDSIIGMAHQMGMLVIAEGVETKEQADYLLQLKCEHMQGYYFSRPVPVEEFEKMVYQA